MIEKLSVPMKLTQPEEELSVPWLPVKNYCIPLDVRVNILDG
jgi:hypothetical protein